MQAARQTGAFCLGRASILYIFHLWPNFDVEYGYAYVVSWHLMHDKFMIANIKYRGGVFRRFWAICSHVSEQNDITGYAQVSQEKPF